MKSEEVNANDAINAIVEMASVSDIAAYVEGDSRKTVVQAAQIRIDELNMAGEPKKESEKNAGDLLAFERPYSTIMIPKGTEKNDQKTVTPRITGTLADGSNYEFKRTLRRGVKEFNIPANVIQMINEAIATEYNVREKSDKTGNEMVEEKVQRWTVQMFESYNEKKTEAEIRAELGIK